MPQIEGLVRRNIVHALTFHEIPPQIDKKLAQLPPEDQLLNLNGGQKAYLSFTVYSLKQMVAVGTISAETAWTLFDQEFRKTATINEINFQRGREELFRQVKSIRGEGQMSLLEFEFCARAGRAGLDQYQGFQLWASSLRFLNLLDEPLKDEYRKALWLEMRLIERRVGIRSLNSDITDFGCLSGRGDYSDYEKIVLCAIDLYDTAGNSVTMPIDSFIKAEIGHWMFGPLGLSYNGIVHEEGSKVVAELMHKMNDVGFTPRIAQSLKAGPDVEPPPEAAVFSQGFSSQVLGLFDFQAEEMGMGVFSAFPCRYDACGQGINRLRAVDFIVSDLLKSYAEAEYLETQIRQTILGEFRAGRIRAEDVFRLYRRLGLHLAIAQVEGFLFDELKTVACSGDVKATEEYYADFQNRTIRALRSSLGASRSEGQLTEVQRAHLGQAPEIVGQARYIDRKKIKVNGEALRNEQ
ncbi:MAG: hypothetical protein JW873_00870 [Candidatus Saganbacteria bacterium]|nr:hypothetical protein [Candidatus Saganbacteria bacterium]